MLFVLGALLGGLLAGWALGGSLRRLERLPMRRLKLLFGSVLVQAIATLAFGGALYVIAIVVSFVLAVAFVLDNPQLAGRGLIASGLGLNALVILANGAMPVVADAAARAGVNAASIARDPRHQLAESGTHLAWLADRIPLALPWQPQVLSVGDVLVAAGVGVLVARAMRRRTSAPTPIRVREPAPR